MKHPKTIRMLECIDTCYTPSLIFQTCTLRKEYKELLEFANIIIPSSCQTPKIIRWN